ncbi:MAG TPA: STAS domain-containing protein, partial [Conexibacter sp.]|nr:STAS domain-containing protein [Conexibacter sp.]
MTSELLNVSDLRSPVPNCGDAPFRCECRSLPGDCQHVVAIGEIDIVAGPHLTKLLREAQTDAPHVVLDLGRTTFMDAGGAHILLAAHARARATAATFAIIGATAPVKRLLALVGADAMTADLTFPPSAKERGGARADVPLAGPQRPSPLLRLLATRQHGQLEVSMRQARQATPRRPSTSPPQADDTRRELEDRVAQDTGPDRPRR